MKSCQRLACYDLVAETVSRVMVTILLPLRAQETSAPERRQSAAFPQKKNLLAPGGMRRYKLAAVCSMADGLPSHRPLSHSLSGNSIVTRSRLSTCLRHPKDERMFKPCHDELHSFLQWRRRTRFIRHHGGPIMSLTLFVTCLWFVWKACERRQPAISAPQVETSQSHDVDHTLQASRFPNR